MKNVIYTLASVLIFCTGLISCTDKGYFSEQGNGGISLNIRMATYSDINSDNELSNMKGFLFSEGTLTGTVSNIVFTPGKPCNIVVDYKEGDHLYLVSEADKVLKGIADEKQEDVFVRLLTASCNGTSAPVYMSGSAVVSENTTNKLIMNRGVARIDLAADPGISVKSVSLNNVYDRGVVFAQNVQEVSEAMQTVTLKADFSDRPATGTSNGVFYLYEQPEKAEHEITATVTFSKDGNVYDTKTVSMPKGLERNKIYTLALKQGEDVSITVKPKDWGTGEETDLTPDFTQDININKDLSTIPDGGHLSEKGDTLYMPYWGGVATLAFSSGNEVACESENSNQASVTDLGNNKFSITTPFMGVEKVTEYVKLNLKIKGMTTAVNSMTVVLIENAVGFFKDKELKERMNFKDQVLDYKRYVDGTLGYLRVPQSYKVSIAQGWIRLDEQTVHSGNADQNVYCIEGGYKPNDPEADGREQLATITIDRGSQNNDAPDLTNSEYVIKRKNYGLPVVEINGVYWCKYNLRGNAKRFEDQVSITCDRDTISSLETFLRDYLIEHPKWQGWDIYIPNSVKSMELFYGILGHGYQAGKVQGMPIKGTSPSSAFYHYPGYAKYYPEEETGLLPADSLAPDGYMIPEYSDFRKLVPADNFVLGTQNQIKEYTLDGKSLSVEVFYMPAMNFNMRQFFELKGDEFTGNFNVGGSYGTSFYYIFKENGKNEPLILMGNPHQYKVETGDSQSSVKSREVIFACHDSRRKAWILNGNTDTESTRMTFINGDANHTKMIRCIKKPVKYIMQ